MDTLIATYTPTWVGGMLLTGVVMLLMEILERKAYAVVVWIVATVFWPLTWMLTLFVLSDRLITGRPRRP